MTKTEKLLRELIALPSVNPAFLPAQTSPRRGAAGGGFPGSHGGAGGAGRGVPSRFPGPLEPAGPPFAPRKVRQRLLLAPHLDTVNAADEQFTPANGTAVCLAAAPATPKAR